MDIYTPQVLSERTIKNFIPTRLTIKELAGKLYFCKSTKQDITRYVGSGVYWLKRVKKYGRENVKTLWVSDWYYDAREIQEIALHFSKENEIVESTRWANLKPENGLDGGTPKGHLAGDNHPTKRPEIAEAISARFKGIPKSVAHKKSLSLAKKGKPRLGNNFKGPSGKTWTQLNPSGKKLCPYCNKLVDPGNYKKWHGDRCKFNQS